MRVVISRVGFARHVTVALSALVGPALALAGVLGGGRYPERFDAKQVLITPDGADGVRIREVVDQDFGTTADRHGYQRLIPNDFGAPIDVQASSPDAPDSVFVDTFGFETRIRIGDPDIVVDGQHRYVLSYTLPDARLSQGELAVDVIGNLEELETGRFEVVIAGFDLVQARCNVGGFGDADGCSFERNGDVYRAVIDNVASGQGITVGGPIAAITTPAEVPSPPIPERRSDRRGELALTMLPLGLAAAFGTHAVARRAGRNEVGGGGEADAAYGDLAGGVQLVPDSKMDELATIEFVPPKDLRPWQAALLLNERVDDTTIGAVISDLIAAEVLETRSAGDDVVELVRGPKFASVAPEDQARAERILGGDGVLRLGEFSRPLEQEWSAIGQAQRAAASGSGWWKKNPPGGHGYSYPRLLTTTLAVLAALVAAGALFGMLRSWPVAIVLAVLIPATVAFVRYRPLLPVLTAAGSGRLLQTESFRRFLAASEGKHVEWAYQNGMLREYSAWAVALGAADTWQRALAQAALPPAAMAQTAPLILYTHGPMFQTTHTRPAPTSGGGGGGFSGGGFGGGFSSGGVGGGGGGGSSGSW